MSKNHSADPTLLGIFLMLLVYGANTHRTQKGCSCQWQASYQSVNSEKSGSPYFVLEEENFSPVAPVKHLLHNVAGWTLAVLLIVTNAAPSVRESCLYLVESRWTSRILLLLLLGFLGSRMQDWLFLLHF